MRAMRSSPSTLSATTSPISRSSPVVRLRAVRELRHPGGELREVGEVRPHEGEGIVHLVGHAGGEHAHALEALALLEQPLVAPLVGAVAQHEEAAGRLAGERRARRRCAARRAVHRRSRAPSGSPAPRRRRSAGASPPPRPAGRGRAAPRRGSRPRSTSRGLAEDALAGAVQVDHRAGGVGQHDAVVELLDHVALHERLQRRGARSGRSPPRRGARRARCAAGVSGKSRGSQLEEGRRVGEERQRAAAATISAARRRSSRGADGAQAPQPRSRARSACRRSSRSGRPRSPGPPSADRGQRSGRLRRRPGGARSRWWRSAPRRARRAAQSREAHRRGSSRTAATREWNAIVSR